MALYPIILNLDRHLAVVVGGGPIGCRKARGLLAAGVRVRLVSLTPPVLALPETDLELRIKRFTPDDLDEAMLVFAATGDPATDSDIQAQARKRGVLVNQAGDHRRGDFHVPAVVRASDLLLTVSTGGLAPALSRLVRDQLERAYGPGWGFLVRLTAALQSRKLTENQENTYTYKVLEKLLAEGVLELARDGRTAAIDQLLTSVIGRETTLRELGLDLRDDLP